MNNFFLLVFLGIGCLSFNSSCVKEKVVHIINENSEDTKDKDDIGEEVSPTENGYGKRAMGRNPGRNGYSESEGIGSMPPEQMGSRGQDRFETPDQVENDDIAECAYCRGSGKSYLGQVTPIKEWDLMNLSLYQCKVCEGKKYIKPSEAKKKVKILEEFYGANWYSM